MTATATAGAATATASLGEIVWDMGDGNEKVCAGVAAKGIPYDAGSHRDESPTCGYTYSRSSARQEDLAYTVTATSRRMVHWALGGAGQEGDIPLAESVVGVYRDPWGVIG
ncbi:hypothetical protein [Cellulomonas sp. URHE0023]|uniref:hypothetical protein n=1 Tax=Cellulomonas sp. URHE0023 TaxID=1380354 RepID=UPI0012DC3C19|nr:hypothetical protein [Cellulomonas sp. URHE0023]